VIAKGTTKSHGILSNSDILLAPEVVAAFPALAHILDDQNVAAKFRELDEEANLAKARYNRFGVCSLILAWVSLEYEVVSLSTSTPHWLDLVAGAAALAAVVLLAAARIRGMRRRWLAAMYSRERLRLWRHQLMLDGAFVDSAISDRGEHDRIFAARWAQLGQELSVSDGLALAAIDGSPAGLRFGSTMPASALRQQVMEMQRLLRLDYQLQFSAAKGSNGLSPASPGDIANATDWLATATLVFSVLVGASAFGVNVFDAGATGLVTSLSAVAVGLAIASAAIRALRAGLTIPMEIESYRTYRVRLQLLVDTFDASADDAERWNALCEVEKLAIEELHRFINMKSRSRYLL
jgi:hypothetical protein